MASLVLSGGCVVNLVDSTDWRPQPPSPVVVHHHHHHFYPVPAAASSPPPPAAAVQQRFPRPPAIIQSSHTYRNLNLSDVHRVLSLNKQMLEECGWYYGSINWAQ